MQPLRRAIDREFFWDAAGRITAIADLADSALSAAYGYDALDRVTSAAQGTASWGYSYNGIGDRLTSTVGAASTSYGYYASTHRLQSLSGGQSRSYTYDAAGNMTSDGTTTWTYGGNGRATGAGSVTFLVNALGQRVKKTGPSSATRFVYDEAGRLWGEYAASGALIQETVWLDDLPVATLRPNGTGVDIYYVHPDHLGTPRAVTRSSDNQFVWKWDNTEPFGNSAPDEDPSGLGAFAYNLRFPGQYYDQETGLNYNYFRDYDPAIGRYVQSDPIGRLGGLNTYTYVRGMPLRLRDVFGLRDAPGDPEDKPLLHPDYVPPDGAQATCWVICKAKMLLVCNFPLQSLGLLSGMGVGFFAGAATGGPPGAAAGMEMGAILGAAGAGAFCSNITNKHCAEVCPSADPNQCVPER